MTWGFRLNLIVCIVTTGSKLGGLLAYDYHITRFAFTSTCLY